MIIQHVNEAHKPENQSRTFFSTTRKRYPDTKNSYRSRVPASEPSKPNPTSIVRNPSKGNNFSCEFCEQSFNAKDHFELHKTFYHANENQQ